LNVWNGLEGIGRDDLEGNKNLGYGNEPDPISLTLSRHSITSTAVSPVNCRISFRLESSASNPINFSTSSSKLNSPSSSCFGLGRESRTSDVATRVTEGERIGIVVQISYLMTNWSCGRRLTGGGGRKHCGGSGRNDRTAKLQWEVGSKPWIALTKLQPYRSRSGEKGHKLKRSYLCNTPRPRGERQITLPDEHHSTSVINPRASGESNPHTA